MLNDIKNYYMHKVTSKDIPDWFKDLPRSAQEEYFKDHPKSQITKQLNKEEVRNNNKDVKTHNDNDPDEEDRATKGNEGGYLKESEVRERGRQYMVEEEIKNNKELQKELAPNSKIRLQLASNLKSLRKPVYKVYKSLPQDQKDEIKAVAEKVARKEQLDQNDFHSLRKFSVAFARKRHYGIGTFIGNRLKSLVISTALTTGGGYLALGGLATANPIVMGLGGLAMAGGLVSAYYYLFKDVSGIYRSIKNTKKIDPDEVEQVIPHSLKTVSSYFETIADDDSAVVDTLMAGMINGIKTANLTPKDWSLLLEMKKSKGK